jgi:hypothetical protein
LMTAAAVSSQLVSMARIVGLAFMLMSITKTAPLREAAC